MVRTWFLVVAGLLAAAWAGCQQAPPTSFHVPPLALGDGAVYLDDEGTSHSLQVSGTATVRDGWLQEHTAPVVDVLIKKADQADATRIRVYVEASTSHVLFMMTDTDSMVSPVTTHDPSLRFRFAGLPWAYGSSLFAGQRWYVGQAVEKTLHLHDKELLLKLHPESVAFRDGERQLLVRATAQGEFSASAFFVPTGTFWLTESSPFVARMETENGEAFTRIRQDRGTGENIRELPTAARTTLTPGPSTGWDMLYPPGGEQPMPGIGASWQELISEALKDAAATAFRSEHPDARLLLVSAMVGGSAPILPGYPGAEERVVRGSLTLLSPSGDTVQVIVEKPVTTVGEWSTPARYATRSTAGHIDYRVNFSSYPKELRSWKDTQENWYSWTSGTGSLYSVQAMTRGLFQTDPDGVVMLYVFNYAPPEAAESGSHSYNPHRLAVNAANGYLIDYFDDHEDVQTLTGASWRQPPPPDGW